MHIERLRLFITLAETGSFYAASKETYLSQQGLSKAIAALESEVGTELFLRSHQGVTLTATGQVALAYAREIVAKHDEMIESMLLADREADPNAKRIKAYLTHYAMNTVRCLERDFLFSRVSAVECSFREVVRRIDEPGDADVLVCGVWPERKAELLSRSDIEFLPLIVTQLGAMVSSSSELAGRKALHRRDVAHLPTAVAANEDVAKGYSRIFRTVPLADVRLKSDDESLLADFARAVPAGAAITDSFNFFLMEQSASVNTAGLTFVPLSTPRGEVAIGIIVRRAANSNTMARQSVRRLAAWLAARYPSFTPQGQTD